MRDRYLHLNLTILNRQTKYKILIILILLNSFHLDCNLRIKINPRIFLIIYKSKKALNLVNLDKIINLDQEIKYIDLI
jgi:hypothetical protein